MSGVVAMTAICLYSYTRAGEGKQTIPGETDRATFDRNFDKIGVADAESQSGLEMLLWLVRYPTVRYKITHNKPQETV